MPKAVKDVFHKIFHLHTSDLSEPSVDRFFNHLNARDIHFLV